MHSQIDPSKPVYGNPTTVSVRQNFEYARDEINSLDQQASSLENDLHQLDTQTVKLTPLGGIMLTGDITCHNLMCNNLTVNGILNVGAGLHLGHVPVHLNNASAEAAGMQNGDVYRDLIGSLHVVI